MPVSLAFIMAFIGMAIAMLLGVTILSSLDDSLICPSPESEMGETCQEMKDNLWLAMGIMPIALFFILFLTMGGLGGADSEVTTVTGKKVKRKHTLHWKILVYMGLAKVKQK